MFMAQRQEQKVLGGGGGTGSLQGGGEGILTNK